MDDLVDGDRAPPQDFTSEAYVRGMHRLLRAVQELAMTTSLDEVQRLVRTAARELTGCDGATFVLRDEGRCFYADEDAITPLWKGLRFPIDACISGWAMTHKQAVVVPDIYADARIPHDAYRPTFVKSLVMVPIRSFDPIGAIGNYWSVRRLASKEEVSLLAGLADATSVALENVRVRDELAARDRRQSALEQEIAAETRGLHDLAAEVSTRIKEYAERTS